MGDLYCVCYAFVPVCLFAPCGHLLSVGLSFSHWYSRSVVVLDCIDSVSLNPYLFCFYLFSRLKCKRAMHKSTLVG